MTFASTVSHESDVLGLSQRLPLGRTGKVMVSDRVGSAWSATGTAARAAVAIQPRSSTTITRIPDEAIDSLSSTVTRIPDEAIASLASLYSFRGYLEVARYLRNHPQLLSPLLEAPDIVSRFFEQGTHLALEVFRDPEAAGHRQLFAVITTGLEGDEALEALRHFDEEWWLETLPRTDFRLAFTLEYA